MSDTFYRIIRRIGLPVFQHTSAPVFLHAERIPPAGSVIIAPNHLSPYDVPCLMTATARPLDFLSITEIMNKPLVGAFFRGMNAFPLDRGRPDPATVREMTHRLKAGRAVVMFPEGAIRTPETSMLAGGKASFRLLELSALTGAPILPCVMLGTAHYRRPAAWFPGAKTRYAVGFGEGVQGAHCSPAELRERYARLLAEVEAASGLSLGAAVGGGN